MKKIIIRIIAIGFTATILLLSCEDRCGCSAPPPPTCIDLEMEEEAVRDSLCRKHKQHYIEFKCKYCND